MPITFKPTDATTIAVEYGVADLLAGYIIQSEDIQGNTDEIRIPDQQGRVAQIIKTQKYYNCSITCVGPGTPPAVEGATLAWKTPGGTEISYVVDTVQKASVYNDSAKWNVTMTAYPDAAYKDATGGAI